MKYNDKLIISVLLEVANPCRIQRKNEDSFHFDLILLLSCERVALFKITHYTLIHAVRFIEYQLGWALECLPKYYQTSI